jgi:tRNA(fMet)-specific endonuclease VapC
VTRYLLDTNVCIRILNNSNSAVVERFRAESPKTVGLCAVIKAELCFGARKSRNAAKVLSTMREFWQPLPCFPFDDDCAEEYGMIRTVLEQLGQPIGANDLLIASVARCHDLVLVTHNFGEFSRVGGLQVEDWER